MFTSYTIDSADPTTKYLTYDVSIYVTTPFELTSDLVFFADAQQSSLDTDLARIATGYSV